MWNVARSERNLVLINIVALLYVDSKVACQSESDPNNRWDRGTAHDADNDRLRWRNEEIKLRTVPSQLRQGTLLRQGTQHNIQRQIIIFTMFPCSIRPESMLKRFSWQIGVGQGALIGLKCIFQSKKKSEMEIVGDFSWSKWMVTIVTNPDSNDCQWNSD